MSIIKRAIMALCWGVTRVITTILHWIFRGIMAVLFLPVRGIMLLHRGIMAILNRPAKRRRAIAKKEKGMNPVNEMKFAVLGPSGAGKTTLLACMAEEFERVSPGTIFPADSFTFGSLTNAYKSLKRDANNTSTCTRQFERSIEGTSMLREFLFHVIGPAHSSP